MDEIINYTTANMPKEEIAGRIGIGVLKATLSVIPIIMAFLTVGMMYSGATPEGITVFWVYTILFSIISTLLIIFGIKSSGKISLKQFIYGYDLDYDTAAIVFFISTIISSVLVGVYMNLKEIFEFICEITAAIISAIATTLPLSAVSAVAFAIMFRNRSDALGAKWTFDCVMYGIITGGILHLSGLIIMLSVDLIGALPTAVCLVFEILFSAIYTYTDLIEWAAFHRENAERDARESRERQEELDLMIQVMGRYP
jgi:hypothetical protein